MPRSVLIARERVRALGLGRASRRSVTSPTFGESFTQSGSARAGARRARSRRAPPDRSRGCRPTPGGSGSPALSSSATMPGAPSSRVGAGSANSSAAVAPEVRDDAGAGRVQTPADARAGTRRRRCSAGRSRSACLRGRLDQPRRAACRHRARATGPSPRSRRSPTGRPAPRTRCRSRTVPEAAITGVGRYDRADRRRARSTPFTRSPGRSRWRTLAAPSRPAPLRGRAPMGVGRASRALPEAQLHHDRVLAGAVVAATGRRGRGSRVAV